MKLQLKCVIILEVLVEIGAPYIMALHVCKCEVTLVQICFSKVGKLKIWRKCHFKKKNGLISFILFEQPILSKNIVSLWKMNLL